jgi:AcrR family transcriptional regulator
VATRKNKANPNSYHHGNLRQALLAATLELIAETGPSGFTLREVARRAGVSHTAPYRHFEDRDALLAAVAADGFRRLDDALRAGAAAASSAIDGFRAGGRAYLRFALDHPAHYRIMFGDSLPTGAADRFGDLRTAGDSAFAALIESIEAAQAEGAIRAGDPMVLALAAWSSIHGLVLLLIDDRLGDAAAGRTDEELAALVSGVLYDGMKP